MSKSSHSHKQFSTTRWSVVMQLAATNDASDAFTELVQRYWYPVYAYVRRCGHAPSVAQDIARGFLAHLMRQFRANPVRPPQGHFRDYLLNQLNAFLGGDWREPVDDDAGELAAPADLEARYQRNIAGATTPEQAYQHSFALEVITRAFRQLREEAQQTGHLAMYSAMEPFLARDPVPGEYEAMAARLEMRPLALVVALKRLRQRFRELVGRELAETVTSFEDLVAEQAALYTILRETHTPS